MQEAQSQTLEMFTLWAWESWYRMVKIYQYWLHELTVEYSEEMSWAQNRVRDNSGRVISTVLRVESLSQFTEKE